MLKIIFTILKNFYLPYYKKNSWKFSFVSWVVSSTWFPVFSFWKAHWLNTDSISCIYCHMTCLFSQLLCVSASSSLLPCSFSECLRIGHLCLVHWARPNCPMPRTRRRAGVGCRVKCDRPGLGTSGLGALPFPDWWPWASISSSLKWGERFSPWRAIAGMRAEDSAWHLQRRKVLAINM